MTEETPGASRPTPFLGACGVNRISTIPFIETYAGVGGPLFRHHIQRYNSPMRKYGLIAILLAAALAGSFYVRGHSHSAIPIAPSAQKDSAPGPMDLPTSVVEE